MPAPSTWASADPGSAWYLRTMPAGIYRCSFDGANALYWTRVALDTALTLTGPLRTSDGSTVTAADVPNDPTRQGWGPALFRCLYAVAARAGASDVVLGALRAEGAGIIAGEPVGHAVLTTALALTDVMRIDANDPSSLTGFMTAYSQIALPADTVYPRWGELPMPSSLVSNASCVIDTLGAVATPTVSVTGTAFAPNFGLIVGLIVATATVVAYLTSGVSTRSSMNARKSHTTG